MNKTIQYLPISKIQPHPLNATIYGDGADKELVESVKKDGIMTPIEVIKVVRVSDGKKIEIFLVISGHRRLNAAQMAGLTEMPCVVCNDIDENDDLAIEERLISQNISRQKTPEQVAREYTRLKEIEEEKAKKRMLSGKSDPVENSPQGIESGKSREIAAKKLGISSNTAERSAKVIAEIDEMKKAGKEEEAEALRKTLNEKSVNAAWKSVKEKKEKPKQEKEPEQEEPEPVKEENVNLETKISELETHKKNLLEHLEKEEKRSNALARAAMKDREEIERLREEIAQLNEQFKESRTVIDEQRIQIENLTKERNHCKLMWEAEERHVRDVKEGAKEDQILVSDLVGKNAELTRQLEYYQNKGKNNKGMNKK